MRSFLWVAATGCMICTSAAFAADKTVHDNDYGFSLTYPEGWTSQALSGNSIRLKVKSAEGLTCMVSENPYDPSDPGSPRDPEAFMDKDWSLSDWRTMVGAAFGSASFSKDRLARFPDGYPVRLADMDFYYADDNVSFHGHGSVALSLRRAHFGFVSCGVAGDTPEEVERKWAPLADEAEKVVSSFVLDAD
ncbi:MAG: hypothetical protein EOS38_32665 [Mesorhizobium sp.]|nr:hypothetical protein EOA38_35400 [Mesorhizobium sp. M1E.F.Ca.ET.041.01.1.1]RWD78881.1 MAG: hypothetical protein EOS38_32665 [Mesorhizobium sp.]RWD81112.1 MAG: hypothetical protein EOS39_31190 [Mesorhizobium sp.]TIV48538.1 MAG: hypothetical protein E5V88_28860 [Mesorhizobium sp.]